jgi:hypothetical protein
MKRPHYFDEIRSRAAKRWDQLEADPELAGPWHQLFKQVQSPRHVLSELLQNADDAGATEAAARLDEEAFTFEHNGEDFTEEHFASLCRFGYSSKRALHTIGFRGVGFKSTFSLGDRVELLTPTLSIEFHRGRFTEPLWVDLEPSKPGLTRVRVELADSYRQREIERNLEEWENSALSLLFFRNLRSIRVSDRGIEWEERGEGPVAGSTWMRLRGADEPPVLLVRSEKEAFPPEALNEIHHERLLMASEEAELPPCHVEIVLGESGRLFVVLPTGVRTDLPFAMNAPFVQDPARLKIKDPETSPTNRWLLARAGRLAASAMLDWIGRGDLPVADRARAYGFLPDVNKSDGSLPGATGALVEEAFEGAIEGCPILITWDGTVVRAMESVAIPQPLFDVWPPDRVGPLLDDQGRPGLTAAVPAVSRGKLIRWGLVDGIDKARLLKILEAKELPLPLSWGALLHLWSFLAPEVMSYRYSGDSSVLRIVPVQGKDVLCRASEVVRLGEKRLLQSDEDWEFLAAYLLVVSPNWTRFLGDRRRELTGDAPVAERERVEAAFDLLEKLGISEASNADAVVARVSTRFFSTENLTPTDYARIAQIAAKLGAKPGQDFRFATRDGRFRPTDETVLFDPHGALEELVPSSRRDEWLMHPEYLRFVSCSVEEWNRWIRSGRPGIGTVPPIRETRMSYRNSAAFEQALRDSVGYRGEISYPYKSGWSYSYQRYFIVDHDFDEALLEFWATLPADASLWPSVARLILEANPASWKSATGIGAEQTSTNGTSTGRVQIGPTPAKWIRRLTSVPCLPDTHGLLREPAELFRRTRETEPLLDVEPFLDHRFDTEQTRPLLDFLGVRSEPPGPEPLLKRLRALAASVNAPIHEVERWYRRLDQVLSTCSTEGFDTIRQAFQAERLVLTEQGSWETAVGVHLATDADSIPGEAVVRSAVRHLTLWRKVGVAERPTVERAIEWLNGLPSGGALTPQDVRRVRGLLARHPARVWEECNHWLALSGEWVPVDDLSYALTMRSLTSWAHLHPHVKRSTADFRDLPGEVTVQPPFSSLPPLSARIEERLERSPAGNASQGRMEWLHALGAGLKRVELESEEETVRVRGLADRLTATTWVVVAELRLVPYIDSVPAGSSRKADVIWLDEELLSEPLPMPRLARRVPEEVGRVFGRAEIKAAMDFSFERPREQVQEYLEANFQLAEFVPEHSEAGERFMDGEPVGLEREAGTSAQDDGPSDGQPTADEQEEGQDPGERPELEGERPPDSGSKPTGPAAAPRPRPPSLPAKLLKPELMERFALQSDFHGDGDDRFVHDSGEWIGRVRGSTFPWERRGMRGDLLRCYFPREQCLDAEPLELESDVWGLLDGNPDTHALVLIDLHGKPMELTGADLRARLDKQEIKLYPARYRLVMTRETK